jgi:hypothetical protein
MKEPDATLAAIFRLLPISVSDDDLKGASAQVRRDVPANFAAIALNGLCFPTAGRILGAGLLLTWFISDLTPDDAERPVYIGVNDTLVGLPTMLLAGAGFIIDAFGFAPVFSSIGMIAIAGALLATRLPSFTGGHTQ